MSPAVPPPPPDTSLPAVLRPNGRGVSLSLNNNRLIISPEYSERTGFALGASYALPLTEYSALGLLFTAGADKREFLVNAGFDLSENQRFIATFGQLRQDMDFGFRSGNEEAEMTQNSGALSYQYRLGKGWLNAVELNGYLADTPSNDLADKTYTIDTATLYELWNDPRRVAGGRVTGLQGRLVLTPLAGATFKLGLGGEELEYDFLTAKDTTSRATGSAEWTQQLAENYTLRAGANTMAAMDRYTLGLSRTLAGGHRLGVDLASNQGRDGVPDDNQVRLSYSYGFGDTLQPAAPPRANAAPAAPAQAKEPAPAAWSSDLLAQVAQRPSFLPSQVVAKVDTTAAPTRLVAINKATLPAGAAIDAATGDIIAPLGVAVLSIAGVTINGGPFVNTGQFSLSGNNIVISPARITQPGVGITDTYVVTVNNDGGGTTLVTVLVSRGSVKIDSITVAAGVDVVAPTTTAAPSVSGTTDTATTLAATINENGTGYYLVQAAAAAAPNVATVIAANHTFAMTANVQATANIAGLVASTAYKIYFVAKDTAGNTQAAVGSVAVTTAAPNLAPTITDLPNFGAGVSSGSTTNKSVTFDDETAWGAGSSISISANNGASIANAAPNLTSYGVKTFDFVAPVNPAGSGVLTVTITYTVTDANGVQTQTTQNVDVAEAADVTKPATTSLALAAGAAYTKNLNVAASITGDTDNIGVTGWYLSENPATPALGAFVAEPNTFNLSAGDGLKTVYVWTRDAAGNISDPGSDTITLDQTIPTLGALPNFGAGVASGSTTAKTIDMTDNSPFAGAAAVSVSADNGASITGFDNTSYGIGKPFNFVAPVNPAGSGPITITITYTITDAAGNITTQTQNVDVAEAANNNPVANNVTLDSGFGASITYDLAPDISDVETPDAGLTIVVDAGPAHTGIGGSFVWNTNTQFTLTADPGYAGSDSFTYHVVDGNGGVSLTKTVTINNFFN